MEIFEGIAIQPGHQNASLLYNLIFFRFWMVKKTSRMSGVILTGHQNASLLYNLSFFQILDGKKTSRMSGVILTGFNAFTGPTPWMAEVAFDQQKA